MYQLLIIGAGPAGLTASIYASRQRIKHAVIGREIGGLALGAHLIENWPGVKSASGQALMDSFKDHAASLGAEIINDQASEISQDGDNFTVKTVGGKTLSAQSLILALGTSHRQLGIPGEKEFLGKGVSYCVTCDGPLFKNKIVAVVGGSDCAAITAVFLADICQKVYVIYRNGQMRCEPIWLERLQSNAKMEIIYNVEVKEIKGGEKVESAVLSNGQEIKLDGLFIEIGVEPNINLLSGLDVALDEENYIKIDKGGATNIPGVYAAGDVTTGSNKLRQVLTSAAEGAIATVSVAEYLKKLG